MLFRSKALVIDPNNFDILQNKNNALFNLKIKSLEKESDNNTKLFNDSVSISGSSTLSYSNGQIPPNPQIIIPQSPTIVRPGIDFSNDIIPSQISQIPIPSNPPLNPIPPPRSVSPQDIARFKQYSQNYEPSYSMSLPSNPLPSYTITPPPQFPKYTSTPFPKPTLLP